MAEQQFTKQEVESGKGMSVLAYFGILALIPYFAEKKNKFVRFHAVQGMNLMLVLVAYAILSGVIQGIVSSATLSNCVNSFWGYGARCDYTATTITSLIFGLIGLAIAVVAIIGIVNAAQGKTKELPIIGKIKIIKK